MLPKSVEKRLKREASQFARDLLLLEGAEETFGTVNEKTQRELQQTIFEGMKRLRSATTSER